MKYQIVTIEEVASSTNENCTPIVIVSPIDFSTYLMELPPLKEDLIEGAVRFRLRSLYPGKPLSTIIDFAPNGSEKGTYIVFAAQEPDVRRYRDRQVPLTAGANLILSAPYDPDQRIRIVLLVAPDWMEAALLGGTRILAFNSMPRSKDTAKDTEELLSSIRFPNEKIHPVSIPLSGVDEKTIHAVEETLKRTTGLPPTRLDTEELASHLFFKERFLFTPPKKGAFNRNIRIGILVSLNLVAVAFAFSRYVDVQERSLIELRSEYRLRLAENADGEALKKELVGLEAAIADLAPRRIVSGYDLLEEIADCIGKGAWTRSVTLRDDSFQIEAEGVDALEILRRFEKSEAFKDIRLHQASPSSVRGERFTLSGNIRYDTE